MEDSLPAEDLDQAKEECPICMNVYRKPKLLECKHTFCTLCLKKVNSSAKDPQSVPCPVCRHVTTLPRESTVESLLTNFYAPSSDVYTCDSCDFRSRTPLMECASCSFCLCKPCYSNHGKDDANNKCHDTEITDASALYPNDLAMRGTIQHLSNGLIRSCYCGDICAEFNALRATCVTKIIPVSGYSAWVLLDGGSDVYKLSLSGQIEDKRTVGCGRTLDICWSDKDGLLAICKGVPSVLKCNPTGTESILDTGNYHPTALCTYENDGLVIGALDMSEPSEGFSYFLIYDSDKTLMKIQGISERMAFKRINSIEYNSLTQQICVADEKRNMVYLCGSETSCESYRKGRAFPTRSRPAERERPDEFTPTSICCDLDGTIFVHDYSTSSIHVISSKGKLLGMLLGSDDDHTGDPSCIAFGPDKKLWIGDMFSGQIRIYTVEQVYNRVGHRSSRIRIGGNGEDMHAALMQMVNNHPEILSSGSEGIPAEVLQGMLLGNENEDGIMGMLRNHSDNMNLAGVCLSRDSTGIHVRSSQNADDPEANRLARRAFANQLLNSPETASSLESDGISVDDVLRACLDADD